MDRDVRCRPANDADFARLYQIHREAIGPWVEATWGTWDEAVQPAFFEAMIGRGLLQVVEVSGETSGLIEVDDRFDRIDIMNIEVIPAVQKRGIGTGLLRAILERANGRTVHLQVLKVNPARRLYERLGFKHVGETSTHFQMAWADELRPGE